MSLGNGSITRTNKVPPSGAPFTAGSANNGLSVDASGVIVLGQDVGAVGDPAQLLSNREIPLNGFTFSMVQPLAGGSRQFLIDPVTPRYAIGDLDNGVNVLQLNPAPGFDLFYNDSLGTPRLVIPGAAAGITQMASDDFVSVINLANAANGGIASIGSSTSVAANSNNGQLQMTPGDGLFLHYLAALTNFAAANVATLNNSPVAGNPTKWVRVDDNGVNRHIPMW